MTGNKQRAFIAVVFIVLCVTLLVYANMNDTSKIVKEFSVENASLLPGDVYQAEALHDLKPEQVKSSDELRKFFLQQPYVQKCELVYTGPNKVSVKIEEKKIIARVFTDEGKYLLAANGVLIEEQRQTAALNLPLISGIGYANKILLKDDQDKISEAITILSAFDRVDKTLPDEISEIIWFKGNQPAVLLRSYNAPVLITVACAQRQAAYLQAMLHNKPQYEALLASAAYIDMRYDKHVFFGNEINPENK